MITVTGHGLKDIDTALSSRGPIQAEIVPAELDRGRRRLWLLSACGRLSSLRRGE